LTSTDFIHFIKIFNLYDKFTACSTSVLLVVSHVLSVGLSLYIGWQWLNFFISAVFRHFVGQALRNVCYSGVSGRHFLNKIAILRTFS